MLQTDENLCSNLETELRKLKPTELYDIATLLSLNEEWKILMSVIQKEDNYNSFKFNSNHIFLIEQASKLQHRNCAEIFLEEWSTMGKKRPTIKNLLDLLTKVKLLRVADYINIKILKQKEVERPDHGPAARITDLSKIFDETECEDENENSPQTDVQQNITEKLQISEKNENVDFDNKTTKVFDDLESENSDSDNLDMINFQINDAVPLHKLISLKNSQIPEDESKTSSKPKIPVFINESSFSEANISANNFQNEDLINLNKSDEKNEHSEMISDDKKEELKEPNIPKFLMLSI